MRSPIEPQSRTAHSLVVLAIAAARVTGVPMSAPPSAAPTLVRVPSGSHSAGTVPQAAAAQDDRRSRAIFDELRRDLERNDRQAIAGLMHYPLIVHVAGLRLQLPDAAALLQHFDGIFTPELREIITHAAGTQEITAGDLMTIEAAGGSLGISHITVPPPADSSSRNPGSRSQSSSGRAPRRILFYPGQPTTQLAGSLGAGQHDAYVIWMQKNQLLDVRIDRVRGRDIVARILDGKTRQPVDARARDGTRAWTGRVPENGDYRIDVVRLASGADPVLSYVMVVGVR